MSKFIGNRTARKMAALFHGGCRVAEELATKLGITGRAVYRIFHSRAFVDKLLELGYTGEIAFEKRHERVKERVRRAYIVLVEKDVPPRNRVGILMRMPEIQEAKITRRSVELWRNQFDEELNNVDSASE